MTKRHAGSRGILVAIMAMACSVPLHAPSRADARSTEIVSVDSAGLPMRGPAGSSEPSLSEDGRHAVFDSGGPCMVVGTPPPQIVLCLATYGSPRSVFLRDLVTGTTESISDAPGGLPGDGDSVQGMISADGTRAAFESTSNNLVPGATGEFSDIFVRDLATDTTRLVTDVPGGSDDHSRAPAISGNGDLVVFTSAASNLVPGDTNGFSDVFAADVNSTTSPVITRLSAGVGGAESNGHSGAAAISEDGTHVAFESSASNLVSGDTNGAMDVFVVELATLATTRVSVSSAATQGNSNSSDPSLSADGSRVAFTSFATNLVAGDFNDVLDVFVRDRTAGTTQRASVASDGSEANRFSLSPAISRSGRKVAFSSNASNLDPNDTNGGQKDVFVRDLVLGSTTIESVASDGKPGELGSDNGTISPDEGALIFTSSNALTPDDVDLQTEDVYIHFLAERQCSNGAQEIGPVSTRLHDIVEPQTGHRGPAVHAVSCELASRGL